MISPKPKVAIISGGFAGLAVGIKIAPHVKTIHVYDPLPVGKAGASSAAAGLIHPIAPQGSFMPNGIENFLESKKLFEIVERLSQSNFIYKDIQLIRTIFTPEEDILWQQALSRNDSIRPLSLSEFSEQYFPMKDTSHLVSTYVIEPAIFINSEEYLRSCWKAIHSLCDDVQWFSQEVSGPSSLLTSSQEYDHIIIAAGFGSPIVWNKLCHSFSENRFPPVKYEKGVTLLMDLSSIPKDTVSRLEETKLRTALVSGDYIIPMNEDGRELLLGGATHDLIEVTEKNISELLINREIGDDEEFRLRGKLGNIFPDIQFADSVERRTGVRLITENYDDSSSGYGLPFVGRHPESPKVWVIAGFGAKGLLFHALSAEYLVHAIIENDDDLIPQSLRPRISNKNDKFY